MKLRAIVLILVDYIFALLAAAIGAGAYAEGHPGGAALMSTLYIVFMGLGFLDHLQAWRP